LGADWVTEVLSRGRTSSLIVVQRSESSKACYQTCRAFCCCGSCA